MTAVRFLEQFPNRASLAPEAVEIELDIRQLFVGEERQYRLLFVVDEGRVSILYVRHASQSWLGE
jgi:ParE toxin of type II toxin-antitoxin system, parDE